MTTIPLITELDGFEIVRNAIAQIIADETVLQQAKATEAGEDPDLWKLNTYLERSNPWEIFRDADGVQTPIVNVWYDSSNTEIGSSNITTRQTMQTTINVDCIANAESEPNGSGHIAGDEQASKNAHKTARLVRGILMHPKYKVLGLSSFVGSRWLQNRQAFQPNSGNQAIQRVMCVRLTFTISHNEIISLEDYNNLNRVFIEMRHDPAGMLIASMDIDNS